MSEFFNVIYVVAAVLLLFGAAVFVHELGHFLVARWCRMRILEFAIGFGPKVFGWVRNGIQYSWRWIPAGGYVKLPQMITSDALEGKSDEEQIPPAAPSAKIAVAVAGPIMNIIFAFVLACIIYFVGLPVAINPPVIGNVAADSPEYKDGIREGDLIVQVDGKAVKSWQDVLAATAFARTNVVTVVTERDDVQMTNDLATSQDNLFGAKMLNLDPRDHPVVADVNSGSPAEEAGLRKDDKFVSFAGVPIVGQQQLVDLIKKRGGESTSAVVQRGDQKVSLTITPRIINEKTRAGQIGVTLTGETAVYRVMKPGPKPWDSIHEVWDRTIQTFAALLHHKETGVGPKDLSGPVGILAMLGSQVNTDYRLALNFLVLLNVNLAILNLLPIPVLDGGHILLAIIEKIRRRPISPRIVEYATTVFALLLISFMLYVTAADVHRFPLWKAMFKKAQVEQSASPGNSAPAAPESPQ